MNKDENNPAGFAPAILPDQACQSRAWTNRCPISCLLPHTRQGLPFPCLSVVLSTQGSERTLPKVPHRQRSAGHRSIDFHHSLTQAVRESDFGNIICSEDLRGNFIIAKADRLAVHHILLHRGKSDAVQHKCGEIPVAQISVFFIRIVKANDIHHTSPTFFTAKSSSKS